MIKLAIIEDEAVYCRELENAIRNSCDEETPEITCFPSGEAFLSSDWQAVQYEVIFLDIELSERNGMEVARILRQSGYGGMLVFTTNYEQYVYEGYEVEAFRYLRKPVREDDIRACMERIVQGVQRKALTFSFNRKVYSIPYRDISYISSSGHYLTVHTREQEYQWKYLLKDLQFELPEQFVRCHRSFVVNLDYMRKLDGKRMVLKTGEIIDVASSYLRSVRKAISRTI